MAFQIYRTDRVVTESLIPSITGVFSNTKGDLSGGTGIWAATGTNLGFTASEVLNGVVFKFNGASFLSTGATGLGAVNLLLQMDAASVTLMNNRGYLPTTGAITGIYIPCRVSDTKVEMGLLSISSTGLLTVNPSTNFTDAHMAGIETDATCIYQPL